MKDPMVIYNDSYQLNLIILVLYVYNLKISQRNVSSRVWGVTPSCWMILFYNYTTQCSSFSRLCFALPPLTFSISVPLEMCYDHNWTFKTQIKVCLCSFITGKFSRLSFDSTYYAFLFSYFIILVCNTSFPFLILVSFKHIYFYFPSHQLVWNYVYYVYSLYFLFVCVNKLHAQHGAHSGA